MKIAITDFLFVKIERTGTSDNEGKRAARTCGIVSPTMTQKATIPPKALKPSIISSVGRN